MKQTKIIMGMPITIAVNDPAADQKILDEVFDYFKAVDQKYSPFKKSSEVSRLNRGLAKNKWSRELKTILKLCEQTKKQTNGYFDIWHDGQCDPSGLVKGWAIQNAADLLAKRGLKNYYIEAGGDIQASGQNAASQKWQVGIRNPLKPAEIVKVVGLGTGALATSGSYIRGNHIYNPLDNNDQLDEVISISVIGPNIIDADRFATAAFAMGQHGIGFIESLKNLQAYMINRSGLATLTTGFEKYVI